MIATVLALLGISGVVGFGALFIFAPTAAAIVVPAIVKAGQAVLATRAGVGIVALGAGILGGEIYAQHGAEEACQARLESRDQHWQQREGAAKAAYDAGRKKRDDDIAAGINADNKARVELLFKLPADLQKRIDVYEKQPPDAGACRVTQRAVDRRDGLLKRPK